MEIIDIVDLNDKVIKSIDENKRDKLKDICRASIIIIKNSQDKYLLQLRAVHDKSYPNCWDFSAAGGVDANETYLDGANRELFEEIGIKTNLTFLIKELYQYKDKSREFMSIYTGTYNGEFNLNSNEVESVKFFSLEQIKQMIQNNQGKIHPQCSYVFEKYYIK